MVNVLDVLLSQALDVTLNIENKNEIKIISQLPFFFTCMRANLFLRGDFISEIYNDTGFGFSIFKM